MQGLEPLEGAPARGRHSPVEATDRPAGHPRQRFRTAGAWVFSVLLNHDWVFHTHGVVNRSRRLAQLAFFLSSKRDILLPLDQGQGADRRGQFFVRFL